MSTVAYDSLEEGKPFIFSQNEDLCYHEYSFETADCRPTSRSITQLSPSSVLGGLSGMLSPSGNAKMSFRSRAYFLLDPAAIVELKATG